MRPSLPVVAAASSLTGALAGALLALLLGIVEPGGRPAVLTPTAEDTPSATRDGPAAATAQPVPAAELRGRRTTVEALGVLRRWDDRRARAWVSGDPTRLRALYSPGSRAGRRDVALLQEYAERGWSVRRAQPQVVAAEALARTRDRVEVRVVERRPEDAGDAGDAGSTAARARVVELVRSDGGWQVDRVAPVSGGRR